MNRVFFTDRDLGKRFPEVLAAAGLTVERHADHFRADCPDDEWLAEVGRRGWIAVTRDRRIRYKPNELAAVKRHHVSLLVVVGRASHAQLAQSFVATRHVIFEFLDRHAPPFIAKVYRASSRELDWNPAAPGRVELWFSDSVIGGRS